ncbi:uncharacterized protein LOC110815830 [Carica papaya]|uniref:uncharacterized protein LOC110815830 n=1 Tax=Carica papaya TaxID=3649 RepID=UPI000B8C82AE|nr:uncharacterized protein LOC110815830 [Carica papaya]
MATNPTGTLTPPLFTGENYHVWAIKMKTYLQAHCLWKVVEDDAEPASLKDDAIINQLKMYEEDISKKPRALSCLDATISDSIFSRIMNLRNPKQVWDKLKEEFKGDERIKMVKVLNLRKQFETLKMAEAEIIKENAPKLLDTVNKIRLLGEDFEDRRVVEKMLVSLHARFEAKISVIEETCNLKTLSVAELLGKL